MEELDPATVMWLEVGAVSDRLNVYRVCSGVGNG
jgi:hypothetical protein